MRDARRYIKAAFNLPVHILLLFSFLFNCKSGQLVDVNLETAKKAIAAENRAYFHSLAKGDSSLFASCYTEDCWIMSPDVPTFCGPKAPFEFFKMTHMTKGIRNGKFISIDLYGNDSEYLTEIGFWETTDIDRKQDSGKFMVVWKKTGDGWKRFRESFSSDGNRY